MKLLKKLIKLCFEDKLNEIFNNDVRKISLIMDNFFDSFKKFNNFLKFLILIFLFSIILLNFIFILFFFFKFKLNFFSDARKFISKIPYLKNINNFILANLFLHLE